MSALHRKLLRDLWRMRAQVVTISLVVACGIASHVTVEGTLLVELGDVKALEIVADVLTSDAVQIRPKARFWIERWGVTVHCRPMCVASSRAHSRAFPRWASRSSG